MNYFLRVSFKFKLGRKIKKIKLQRRATGLTSAADDGDIQGAHHRGGGGGDEKRKGREMAMPFSSC